MKKVISLFVVLFSALTIYAEQIVSLQHEGVLSLYYGEKAYQTAYIASVDGDTIVLSPGTYSIIGCSKDIVVYGTYGLTSDAENSTVMSAGNVVFTKGKFEGIYFSGDILLGVWARTVAENVSFRSCFIHRLSNTSINPYAGYSDVTNGFTHNNTLVDKCIIDQEDAMVEDHHNYQIRNSVIHTLSYKYENTNSKYNSCYIHNCLIYNFNSNHPLAVYYNCILGLNSTSTDADKTFAPTATSEFYHCCFYRYTTDEANSVGYLTPVFENGTIEQNSMYYPSDKSVVIEEKWINTESLSLTGSDGTPLGITGGEGFNEYPAIPRILKSEFDYIVYDLGKLNGKMTVKAEK